MKNKKGKEGTITGGKRKGQKEGRKATKLTKKQRLKSEKSSILMRNISSL